LLNHRRPALAPQAQALVDRGNQQAAGDVAVRQTAKPRDKAKVEVAVQVVEQWLLARLRHRRFFLLGELNTAIRELTNELNSRTMRRIRSSRRSCSKQSNAAHC